jgi:hypothetical protein
MNNKMELNKQKRRRVFSIRLKK